MAGLQSQVPRCSALLSACRIREQAHHRITVDKDLALLAGAAQVCDVQRAVCVNGPGQQGQLQEHLHLQSLLISKLFLFCNACLMFVEEVELYGKRAPTSHMMHFKGIVCGLPIHPWSA